MTLKELKDNYEDNKPYHRHLKELFEDIVNNDEQLNAHRTFVEQNAFGFGERAFGHFWNLMVQEMPDSFSFCEIGVFRFQIVSLIKLLSDRYKKQVKRYAVTPLSSIGIGWESDYGADGERIHDEFGLAKDYIVYKGLSNEDIIVKQAEETAPYDIVYIDGDHSHDGALFDLLTYSKFVKVGGYLVIDDAACRTDQDWGIFQGIDTVCTALDEWEKSDLAKEFEFQFNIVHLMIYKRIA